MLLFGRTPESPTRKRNSTAFASVDTLSDPSATFVDCVWWQHVTKSRTVNGRLVGEVSHNGLIVSVVMEEGSPGELHYIFLLFVIVEDVARNEVL